MRGFITAMRTLTILPVPGREADRLADALPFFPVAGLLVGGLVAAGVTLFARALHWPAGAGALGAVLGAALTRGLHLDGLADSADGLLGGRTRERKLAIMKDPNVGAFGAIAVVLALLVKAVALTRLAQAGAWWWIAIPFVAARGMQVELICTRPYARAEGGTAGPFVAGARRGHLAAALAISIVLATACGGPGGLLFVAAAGLAAVALGRRLDAALGGITGDTLGLANELIESGGLFALAALAPWLHLADWRLLGAQP
jgi:adenosylcobinamide-GDP ribazoletransferase